MVCISHNFFLFSAILFSSSICAAVCVGVVADLLVYENVFVGRTLNLETSIFALANHSNVELYPLTNTEFN
jgi:hypothetical protein